MDMASKMETTELIIQLTKLIGGAVIIYLLYKIHNGIQNLHKRR